MTRGIFDPTGGNTERSGSSFTPPEAQQDSHMPPEVEDGVVDEEEEEEQVPLPGVTPEAPDASTQPPV